MATDITINGIDGVIKKMSMLGTDLKLKGGRAAGRKAANFIKNKLVQGAASVDDNSTTESIYKNAAVRFSNKTFKATGNVAFRVGILGGARNYAKTKENVRSGKAGKSYATGGDKSNPGGDTWYWRLVEFGTESVAARPFVRPALENNAAEATNIFAVELEKAIDRTLKRAGVK